MTPTAIIIPTWNNPQFMIPCVSSIIRYTVPEDLCRIYIVNNGAPEHTVGFEGHPMVTILQQTENIGWEGGLKAGLAASTEPYVLFMNDDTFVPYNQRGWLARMLNTIAGPNVAAVGPTSNVVMGNQQLSHQFMIDKMKTKFLIGFCLLVRRSDLEAAGGIDDQLPGGDDLDLSIRLRKLGKELIIDRDVFIYHHGFKTGERVHGTDWNSLRMKESTDWALQNKHGLWAWLDLWSQFEQGKEGVGQGWGDPEADLVRKFVAGERIAEIGCGDKKIIDGSIGIDVIPKGKEIPGLRPGRLSIADVTCNVEGDLPIKDLDTIVAQHILEHMVDAVGAVQSWRRSLKPGGRLIIAVPDHTIRNTIPMNWEHRHAWTPASLKRFMESLGWHVVDVQDSKNQVSFVGVFEANGLH